MKPSLPHRPPAMSVEISTCGSKSAKMPASSRMRRVTVPSSSPMANLSRMPKRTSPGPSMSPAKPMSAPIVRAGPAFSAIRLSHRPFCSDTTYPSASRSGRSWSQASPVNCAFTASATAPQRPSSSAGVTMSSGCVNSATGPTIRSPFSRTAATWAGEASTTVMSCPARARKAATVPPMAPAPHTSIRPIRHLPPVPAASAAPGTCFSESG
mgnify:CR=1 FL=1